MSKHRECCRTRTQKQTHICSVTSSVLLSAEQMQGPARQLVACDDFLWALYGGSSWVHPGLGDSNKMCEEHQKFTCFVHMCADVGLCAHVPVLLGSEPFSHTPIMFPEKGKRKKTALPKNAKLRHPPPLSLTWNYKAHQVKQTNGGNCCTFCCKQTHFFSYCLLQISLRPCHKM